ncbi:MAG: hypothetical protein NTU47_14970 [Ignavibacteriales bacterium]|nr:hypothetical protein [Ignavibacteriales bacterium]
MKRRLSSLVDKGCWISHDRIYAFVSAEHGITEVGYHGLQPVSKNSRILVHESGVLSFSVRVDNKEHMLQTNDVDWQPTRIESDTLLPGGVCSLAIAASGRGLVVRCTSSSALTQTLCVRMAKESPFTAVHGERTWSPFRAEGGNVVTRFRDQIMLQKWIRRTGPYAGDFLIPEPVRKKIFSTPKRSGLAVRDDLRPEFQDTDLALYDAECVITFGGTGWSISETANTWIFEQTLRPGEATEFTIRCSDQAEAAIEKSEAQRERPMLPGLALPGFPHLEEFAATVPGLVESCIVRDYGIPRACPGRYYWIWAWDSLVTMMEALRWGDRPNVLKTVRFIEHHRDEEGRIPARWTRSLLPLDTPSPGGIEFLQAALVYEAFLETNDDNVLRQSLPSFIARFEASEQQLLREGLVKGEGFYPDLLSAFGRSEQSAVCMEVGSWYAFCRILENIARQIGDDKLEERTSAAAARIAQNFSAWFWDTEAGFFIDSVNADADTRSRFHPLFALLFLQSPLGLPLMRPHVREAAAFIGRELVTDAGTRVIPLSETGPSGEDVLDSWYPHWDFYALTLLRRAGDAGSIMRWLRRAEEALSGLGYCPEFLALKGFRENDPRSWEHHGSASNLNCVTAWHRALRESVVGFEFDPGGITHVPLSLPLAAARMEGIEWRGGTWTFETVYGGPHFESLSVDGTIIDGCTKIPSEFHSPKSHVVTARYGNAAMLPCFTEVTNAKVLSTRRLSDAVEVRVEPMGFVDAAFFSAEAPRILVDGRRAPIRWDRDTGYGSVAFLAQPACTLRMEQERT